MIRKVLEVKLRGLSIWHNRVLEVTREGLRKQRRSLKAETERRIERRMTARHAVETAEQQERRLSKPRTEEKARRAAAWVVSRSMRLM